MSAEGHPHAEPPVCPVCGLVLPPGRPATACPRCLLARGMQSTASGMGTAVTQFASDPAVPGAAAELADGAIIDRYRIGKRIGRGGMGEVYAAEQVEPVKRPVAFKVIKRGMDTDHIIGRFQTERQALAMMDHPNIAVVLDAGATPAGRPFFVMEFVQGVPLTTYCDDKQLPLRARLDLFLQVCGAIQHAHQKGIIHRDLKPSNILVGEEAGQPVPKVIDFGLAKATGQDAIDHTLLTEAGQVLGTPAYMSPEQAGGTKDLDTRADVYALGAVLYELITGEPPFDRRRLESAAWEEILRLIREEEPPRPSARLARINRYGVPALAGSGTARERGRSNAAAHEPPKGGTPNIRGTPSTVGTSNATSREPPKGGTPSIRGAPSKGATRSKGGTRSIPADLDWIVMKAIEKERDRRYDTVSGLAGDVRHFLAHEPVAARPPTAAYRLGKFVRRHRRSLATAAVLTAGILSTAGVWAKAEWDKRQRTAALSQQVLGLVAEAERAMQENDRVDFDNDEPFRRALELTERAKALLGRESPVAIVAARLDPLLAAVGQEDDDRKLIGELEETSIAAFSDEDKKESFSRYRQVLVARRMEPGRLPGEAIAARWAGHREAVRSRLAAELGHWAGLLSRNADHEHSLRDWLWQVVDTIDPDDLWRNQVRTAARNGDRAALVELAGSPGRRHQPVEVVVQLAGTLNESGERARSTSILEELLENNPSSFRAHLALGTTMGDALNSIDRRLVPGGKSMTLTLHFFTPGEPPPRRREYDEAIGHLTAAVALRPGTAGAWLNLGNTLRDAGRIDESIAAHRKAIDLDPGLAAAHVGLGSTLSEIGDLEGAIAETGRAIELQPDGANAHNNLGADLQANGDLTGAIASFRTAIELQPDLALAHLNLSRALHSKEQWDGAIAEARKATELQPDLVEAHDYLGSALQAKGELDGAIAAYRKAIELKPDRVEAHVNLGHALSANHDLEGAIAEARRAIELQPDLAGAHSNLSIALADKGDLDGAIAEALKAIALKPDLAEAHGNLGNALRAKGEAEGAVAAYRKAVELKPDDAETHVKLANALQSMGEWDGAIAAARNAIELRPDWAQAHVNLGAALYDKGQWDAAIAEALKAIELNPNLAEAHMNLGNALYAKGDLDGAIAEAGKAIALKPELAEAHLNLGAALRDKGDFDGAIAEARRAIELQPDFAGAHYNLGIAFYAKGDLDEAIEEARKAIALKPDWVQAHNNLGIALVFSGSFSAALDSFERALASGPSGRDDQGSAQNIGATKNLLQKEAALVARLKGASASGKPPARLEHEAALDGIYRGLGPQSPPAASALREYADSHREKLRGALQRATIQMITISKAGVDGVSNSPRQRQWAAEVRRKAAGGADFGELASSYSVDSFTDKGGLREITRMSLKRLLSDAVFALKPAQLSPVIEDETNFYLIRMVARQGVDPKTINVDDLEVRSAIAEMIEAERREAWKQKFFENALKKAKETRTSETPRNPNAS